MTRALKMAAAVLLATGVLAAAPTAASAGKGKDRDAGAGLDAPTKQFQDKVAERQRHGGSLASRKN